MHQLSPDSLILIPTGRRSILGVVDWWFNQQTFQGWSPAGKGTAEWLKNIPRLIHHVAAPGRQAHSDQRELGDSKKRRLNELLKAELKAKAPIETAQFCDGAQRNTESKVFPHSGDSALFI
jgi:hypothetical protein